MPDDDKVKISDLTPALTLDNTDDLVIDQGPVGSRVTKRTQVEVLGTHFAESMNFSSALETTSKTLVGAINELAQGGGGGGSSTLAGLTDVNITSPSNNQVLKYNSTNNQILKYDSATGKWINGNGGGGSSCTDLIGTLLAGQTSLTIQNASITTSSTIDYYTDVFGVSPTDVVVTSGQIVLTFEAQSSDLGVKVRVS